MDTLDPLTGYILNSVCFVYAVAQHRADGSLKIRQVPTNSMLYPETYIPNNLGVVIKAMRLLDFNQIIKQILDSEK